MKDTRSAKDSRVEERCQRMRKAYNCRVLNAKKVEPYADMSMPPGDSHE